MGLLKFIEDLYEEKVTTLSEAVAENNPYLKKGMLLWLKDDPEAIGLIVSVRPSYGFDKGKEVEVNKTYHSDLELHDILNRKAQSLGLNGEGDFNVSAIHNKSMLPYYAVYKEVMKELNGEEENSQAQEVEAKNARLNKARQANKKIIDTFKDAGLPVSDLVVDATDKNGRPYKKASMKLNKLRKSLFGESLEDNDEDISDLL